MAQRTSPAGLVAVHPADENAKTDIDIIAIHGLNARSPGTWTWEDPSDPDKRVNWLKDPKMLPSIVGSARIFTCDWPADMFQKSIPVTLEESAKFLLSSIKQHLLVDKRSATAQIFKERRLNRHHVQMNKFAGPECEDYKQVAEKIQRILGEIREEQTPLEKSDAWIREKLYTEDTLKIERLSGARLPMDQCYINLAIVEQSGQDANHPVEGAATTPSPFSLLARQKVETPDKKMQVELAAIFDRFKRRDGHTIQPRRIMIRGRAGVGKTTLCKKMVHDFTHGTQTELNRSWTKLFDRLLWVPLRNLKGRSAPGYNYEDLFHHEYFSRGGGHGDGRHLAEALWRELRATDGSRTLFILDGMDEISQELGGNDHISLFLTDLLNRPNVIVTSRPNANLPATVKALDRELETVGFYSDQVEAYIDADPKMKPRASEVKSFLQNRWLLRGLVRIPIQLDAFCYTWEHFGPQTAPDTMTDIYKSIVQRLWKKDVSRLEKRIGVYGASARPAEIERSVKAEIALLECLAFNGLYHGVIDFTPAHRDEIIKRFKLDLPLDETLGRLSFLRTSSQSRSENQTYHFLHLTYQEYFAARYFVRCWKDTKDLEYVFKGQENTQSDPQADPAGRQDSSTL
ncbi:uncharacterized protein DNG_09288 [Cephalotrichum gorgonifer]|uniref:NACHT domain-containing protein n=1 Tax=Cephalotrichum gorgonifer TaxID=2041049 RepID=A0AAE8SZ96_9PEZI|nr:uncharacterized protein DNG_09288 [Cephalotrichum gorgonifer]